MARTKEKKPAERQVGWDRADSCTDDLTRLAKKFFGAAKVGQWMAALEKHIASGANYTGYEAYLMDNFASLTVAQKTTMFFEEIVARCLYTVAELDDHDDEDEGDGKVVPSWGERSLKGLTFHDAELVFRPNGYAKVTYMGKTEEPEVPGMIGINCVIHADGEPYRKPTVLFVSKPFHQYRAINVR